MEYIVKKASISHHACSFYVVVCFRLNAKESTILACQHLLISNKNKLHLMIGKLFGHVLGKLLKSTTFN